MVFNYLHDRVNQYTTSNHQKQKDLGINHQIAMENNYRTISTCKNFPVPNDTTHNKSTHRSGQPFGKPNF